MEGRVCKKEIEEFFYLFVFFLPDSLLCEFESTLFVSLLSYTLSLHPVSQFFLCLVQGFHTVRQERWKNKEI